MEEAGSAEEEDAEDEEGREEMAVNREGAKLLLVLADTLAP